MSILAQDLRYAARQLRNSPGFAAAAVLTLALGIGANTAVFSVVNTVLLEPLPYRQPERLVSVMTLRTRNAVPVPSSLSFPDFFDLRARNHTFEHLITSHDTNMVLTGSGEPQQLDGQVATWDMFPALGVKPQLGRGFLESEEAAGTHVVVLSHALWRRQFGADRGIVGRAITLDRKSYTVVGVAPPGFAFPVNEPKIQLWTTIATDKEAPPGDEPITEQRGAHLLTALGRLKPRIRIEQATADLDIITEALAKQYPDSNTNSRRTMVRPALATLVGDSREPLLLLLGAVGLVLLIACANIANLLFARTIAREREISVRAALGASRARVLRQLLTESALLALLGGTAGAFVASQALSLMLPIGGQSIPRLAQASIDGRVLAFSLILVFLTTVLFGMAPAWQASRTQLTDALNERSRGESQRHNRIRGTLVVGQVALGLILVTGAGLLMASLLHLENGDLGFNPDHVLTFWFSLPETQYSAAQQVAFYNQLLERMRAVPGVRSAAGVWPVPFGSDYATVSFNIEERPQGPSSRPSAAMAITTPDYFSTAGIPLLRGRFFNAHDDLSAPRVLLVNKAFADKFFPGENVIGKRITPGATGPGEKKESLHEIVGVVGTAKLWALEAKPEPIYYFPYKQLAWQPPVMLVRTSVPPRSLASAARKQVAALDPLVPVFQVNTMEEMLATQVTAPRFQTLLLGCFAGIALLLTMVGLYGVMAYSVTRRTREIGVRMALGASRQAVLSMVLKEALLLLAGGLVLGFAGSLAGGRLLGSMVHGVSVVNPVVLGLSGMIVAITGLVAAFLPARRAAGVAPITALRHE